MNLDIVRADPAGNITIFVLNLLSGDVERTAAAQALLADPGLQAEQVGFVLPPGAPGGLWALEMAGGEFCGNASRSFGLLVARKTGLKGKAALTVKVSGAPRPLEVHIDTDSGNADIEVPGPLSVTSVELHNRIFPVYVFDGISHVIAEDIEPDLNMAHELLNNVKQTVDSVAACGILFWDSKKKFMRPMVWVRKTETFISESSCGSGSAALAVWLARNTGIIDQSADIIQPGGIIETRIVKKDNAVTYLSIGGKVTLSSQSSIINS